MPSMATLKSVTVYQFDLFNPYTCDVCWDEEVDLRDVLNKRKKSKLIPGKSRLGVCGFRKSYSSKSETEDKSEELNAENVSLKRENRKLR